MWTIQKKQCPRLYQDVCCYVTLMYILLLLLAVLLVRSHSLLLSTRGNLGHNVNMQSFLRRSFSCWVPAAHRAFSFSACPALCAGEVLGKQSSVGKGSKAPQLKPEVVWCVGGADVRGKVCLCLSTILILTHSSRNSQSLLFSIIKGARRFAAVAVTCWAKQTPPRWASLELSIKRALAAELWDLPAPG